MTSIRWRTENSRIELITLFLSQLAFEHFRFQNEAACRSRPSRRPSTPSSTCTRPRCSSPSLTTRFSNLVVARARRTPPACLHRFAAAVSGMTIASCKTVVTISTSANMPGFKRPSVLSDLDPDFQGARLRFHAITDAHDFPAKRFVGISEHR